MRTVRNSCQKSLLPVWNSFGFREPSSAHRQTCTRVLGIQNGEDCRVPLFSKRLFISSGNLLFPSVCKLSSGVNSSAEEKLQ